MVINLTAKQQRLIAGIFGFPFAACAANYFFGWGWFGSYDTTVAIFGMMIVSTVLFRLGPPDGSAISLDVGDTLLELALILVPLTVLLVVGTYLQPRYSPDDFAPLFAASATVVVAVMYGFAFWMRKRRSKNPVQEPDNGKD